VHPYMHAYNKKKDSDGEYAVWVVYWCSELLKPVARCIASWHCQAMLPIIRGKFST